MPSSPVRGGKEYVTPEDIEVLVEFNKRLMARRDHHFGANSVELEKIFKELDQFRKIQDHHARILSMAAWILYKIVERRPFYDGNKTSAWAMGSEFLKWNGYYMPMQTDAQKKDLHRLLTGVQRNTKGFSDVKAFLQRRTIHFYRSR